jgi:hypothetical protein
VRKTYAGLSVLLTLIIVAQFVFAAVGAFSTAPHEESFQPHHALGYVIFVWAAVMAIVAAVARMPGRLIGMPALVAGLTGLQVVIAEFAKSLNDTGTTTVFGGIVGGLHAVNALAILGIAGTLTRQARTLAQP